MSIKAMKQALDALDLALRFHGVTLLSDPPKDAWKYHGVEFKANKAITALRQAIAEEQEPFGIWHQGPTYEESDFHLYSESGDVSCPDCIKLYTHPQPKREPLTDEQITEIFSTTKGLDFYLNFARAIEAAHGIKGEA